jgi:hypothetical protein
MGLTWQKEYASRFQFAQVDAVNLQIRAGCMWIDPAELHDNLTFLRLVEAVFHEASHAVVHAVQDELAAASEVEAGEERTVLKAERAWMYVTNGDLHRNVSEERQVQWIVYEAFRRAGVRVPRSSIEANIDNAGSEDVRKRPSERPDHPLIDKLLAEMNDVLRHYRSEHYKTAAPAESSA